VFPGPRALRSIRTPRRPAADPTGRTTSAPPTSCTCVRAQLCRLRSTNPGNPTCRGRCPAPAQPSRRWASRGDEVGSRRRAQRPFARLSEYELTVLRVVVRNVDILAARLDRDGHRILSGSERARNQSGQSPSCCWRSHSRRPRSAPCPSRTHTCRSGRWRWRWANTPALKPLFGFVPGICVSAPVLGFFTKPKIVGSAAAAVCIHHVDEGLVGAVVGRAGDPRITQLGLLLLPNTGVAVQVGTEVAIATGPLPTFTLVGVPRLPSELIGKIATPPGPGDTGPSNPTHRCR
jgi:hypothetical protein